MTMKGKGFELSQDVKPDETALMKRLPEVFQKVAGKWTGVFEVRRCLLQITNVDIFF